MKRRTLDVLFSVGGLMLAGLLLVLAVVMTSNANFSKNYVKDQLSQQQITFKPAATLTARTRPSQRPNRPEPLGPAPTSRPSEKESG